MWKTPEVRGGESGHRQATWAELFFDLIFVVAVAQLATRLVENVSWSGVSGFAFVYFPIWMSWIIATFYSNRFDTDDLGQRLITFAQMLTVAGMAASVSDGTAIQFAISIAVFRVLVAISYTRVRSSLPTARALANRMIMVMVISASIWVASVFLEGNLRLAMWAAATVLEIVFSMVRSSRELEAAVPLHMDHLLERFGLFTIIVLGETVLAVVIGVAHAHWVASAVVFAPIGLTLSFSLWWIYFEVVTGSPLEQLGGFRPIVWVLAHAPLVMAITALGVGIEVAVFTESGQSLEVAEAMVLAGSLAVALASVGILLVTESASDQRARTLLSRLPVILLVFVVGLLPIAAQAVLVGLALVTATQAIVDVRVSRRGQPL